jgi:murein DD-endopeptidase MepM/ murein hydrolase activator NlpD
MLFGACAPVLPTPVSVPPLPEVPAESPAPTSSWSSLEPLGEADLTRLRLRGLLVPVRGVRVANIADSFDALRDGGRRHDAVDILAPRGTPVVSATDGVVLRVGTNALGGNVIWVGESDGRFVYYYAHLDRAAREIRVGTSVSRGDLLGYVGTTGNAPPTVPHLHFQVMRVTDLQRWWNGTPVNPYPFLMEPGGVATVAWPRAPWQ